MKNISTIRRTVTTMANQLHKPGYSLSQAFRTAWKRVKESMTCNVSGMTYENLQQFLKYIACQREEDLTVYLGRDKANTNERYAVAVVVGIKGVGYAHIGYLAKGLAPVIEKGIQMKSTLQSPSPLTTSAGLLLTTIE